MFAAPVPLIRKKHIINKLRECKAFSPETAVTFEKAGVINPHLFKGVTRVMTKQGTLVQCGEKYYLSNQ